MCNTSPREARAGQKRAEAVEGDTSEGQTPQQHRLLLQNVTQLRFSKALSESRGLRGPSPACDARAETPWDCAHAPSDLQLRGFHFAYRKVVTSHFFGSARVHEGGVCRAKSSTEPCWEQQKESGSSYDSLSKQKAPSMAL